MQNDMLKNEIAPWQEKGRWYHATIDSTGIINVKSDKYIVDNFTISNTTYRVLMAKNPSIRIINYVYTALNRTVNNDVFDYKGFRYTTSNNCMGVIYGSLSVDGTYEVWLFIVED